ncbi:LLM class flavin-dependent oxidoreductase [Kribbella caucasensis]|nr:LLM class flavin-dependent oxidoreductase [Kribbella sp. VKM Ac-2527]
MAALETGRFLGWITNQPPYCAFHAWLGRGEALAQSRRRFDTGDVEGAGQALPDEIVDGPWLHGTPDDCRQQIAAFRQTGVTSILLYVAPTPELVTGADALTDVLAYLASS